MEMECQRLQYLGNKLSGTSLIENEKMNIFHVSNQVHRFSASSSFKLLDNGALTDDQDRLKAIIQGFYSNCFRNDPLQADEVDHEAKAKALFQKNVLYGKDGEETKDLSLLKFGKKDVLGRNTKDWLVEAEELGSSYTLNTLMSAVEQDDLQTVQELLTAGADVNFVNTTHKNETPLHVAVTASNAGLVKLLLAKGANTEARNVDNKKPMDLCSILGEKEQQQIEAVFNEQFYRRKLLTMVLFRLLHDDQIESFYLGSNLGEVGLFDDVVLRTCSPLQFYKCSQNATGLGR
ncbi:hypothetical protein quinque_014465 [Culex quinquefasciatus]